MTDKKPTRLPYLLRRASSAVRTKLEAEFAELEISAGQYAILSTIGAHPQVSSAQLARRFGVTPQTMAETITGFEARGLVARTVSPEHKRVMLNELTEAGWQLLESCDARADAFEARLSAELTPDQYQALQTALKHIIKMN